MAVLRLMVAAALTFQVQGVTWVKGAAGSSCTTVCSARGGCTEEAWPTSEEEFTKVAAEAGLTCSGTQEGGAKYDPSTDGRYCGWAGPAHADPQAPPRCDEAGDSSTYRFCPCNSDKEL
eukprot:TRINITY_DN81850_c0_g1_i1.p1 TRINITY_DN81850_c0_g1~~TRINITY_DN81850_c0_g1_i1.p1  ORF type:complete len:119 (-),score=30.41 TRINITY_DN81850_c0_g1_i1:118-474(-)